MVDLPWKVNEKVILNSEFNISYSFFKLLYSAETIGHYLKFLNMNLNIKLGKRNNRNYFI